MEGRKRRRPRLRWEDCVELAGAENEGEKSGDDSEIRSVTEARKQKSTTGLTPDFRDKEERNSVYCCISINLC